MTCPFIDCGLEKCQQVFRLDQLLYVMSVCGNHFERCPIYQEQVASEREDEQRQRLLRKCA